MNTLVVELAKRADGGCVLRCVRADGSISWQRHDGHTAGFFAQHDLTHLAAESELGISHGFFGLVANGWEIQETDGKSARGPLPPEALLIEHVVGFLDKERASSTTWSASEAMEMLAVAGVEVTRVLGSPLTDEQLTRIRRRRGEFFLLWDATAPGATLRLPFASHALGV